MVVHHKPPKDLPSFRLTLVCQTIFQKENSLAGPVEHSPRMFNFLPSCQAAFWFFSPFVTHEHPHS